jgi:hypothetical protein
MTSERVTDDDRLLFGAGFAFGVLTTLLVLVAVLAAVAPQGAVGLLASPVLVTIAAGVLFVGVVGVGLYLLSFPENRTTVAVDPALFGLDDEE